MFPLLKKSTTALAVQYHHLQEEKNSQVKWSHQSNINKPTINMNHSQMKYLGFQKTTSLDHKTTHLDYKMTIIYPILQNRNSWVLQVSPSDPNPVIIKQ